MISESLKIVFYIYQMLLSFSIYLIASRIPQGQGGNKMGPVGEDNASHQTAKVEHCEDDAASENAQDQHERVKQYDTQGRRNTW